MSCCLPKLLIWKRPVSDSLEANEDHTRNLESHAGLPPKSNISSDTGIGTPHTTASTTAERGQLAHRSNDLRECEVVNVYEVDATGSQLVLPRPGTAVSGLPMTDEPGKAVGATVKPRRDLWEEAFTKLDKGKQDLLCKFEISHGPKVVDRVAKQTEELYGEHVGRGWEATLKKRFESALKSVIKCKELIGACLASDPTGHAAAAWTIVSLGLQLAQNEMDRRETILKASELLAEHLVLLAAIDESYRTTALHDTRNLEDVIVGVYKAILEMSAEIVYQNSLSSSERALKSVTALVEDRLQELKNTLVEAQDRLSTWTSIIEQQYRTEKGKELNEKVDKILDVLTAEVVTKISVLESRALTAEEDKILDWYSRYPFFESHKDAMSRRDADTGAWILESSEYKAWKESGDKVLWLYGNSGCGKSVLCSTIVEDLRKVCHSDSSRVLAYWYFTFGIQESLDIDNLRCSFIKQLCGGTHKLPDRAREHWEKHCSEGPRINSDHLSEILDSLVFGLEKRGKETFLVLDALDEFPLLERSKFLLWIQHFSKSHLNVHVLIASRDEIDIRQCLGEGVTLDVANGIIGDVNKFIQSCLTRITEGADDWKNEYRSRMYERMTGVGERRFRWVALVEQRFSICIDSRMMEDALRDLPETLEGLYDDLLKRIPKVYKEKARLILMWVAYFLRPLTLQELASAVSISNPQKVLEVCNSSFISSKRAYSPLNKYHDKYYNISQNIVKLDHFSVKEYLVSGRLLASDEMAYFHVSPLLAHLTLAELSVSRLIKTNDIDLERNTQYRLGFVQGPKIEHHFPREDCLLQYSAIWYGHIQEADACSESSPESRALTSKAQSAEAQLDLELLRIKAHRLFCSEFFQGFRNWCYLIKLSFDEIQMWKWIPNISPLLAVVQPSPIMIASSLDMVDNVRRLLSDGVNVDEDVASDVWGVTKPVQVAAVAGSLKVLRLLLDRRAILNQSDLDVVARHNSRHGASVLAIILQTRQDLPITHDTVRGFASNTDSVEMFEYFLGAQDVLTLTESMFVAMMLSHRRYHGRAHSVAVMFKRFLFVISYSQNILVTKSVMSHLAIDTDYGHVVFSLLMDHGSCDINDSDLRQDFRPVFTVESHLRTCPVGISRETMGAAARWDPDAIEYLQENARPNVKFAENDPEAKLFDSKTLNLQTTSAAKSC